MVNHYFGPTPVQNCFLGLVLAFSSFVTSGATIPTSSHPLEVLAPEFKLMTDDQSGAELRFLTTDPGKDANLYFHEYSWLADESLILFTSTRTNGGLMGYLDATGELVRLDSLLGPLGGATAAAKGSAVFALQGRNILEIKLAVQLASDPRRSRSRVIATERLLCTLPDGVPSTSLNPGCDGKYLALGVSGFRNPKQGPTIFKVHIPTGRLSEVCRLSQPPGYGGHVQWSRTNPYLISFAGGDRPSGDVAGAPRLDAGPEDYARRGQRLWVVDIRKGVPRNVYRAVEGELVTHESWWVHDQILFCGGSSSTPAVLSHVKALDLASGQIRIVGAGAWWPDAWPSAAARLNWWHAAGSADGRWIAADNWHGDIMLFEGKTTRPHLLTSGHRTYGGGEHPHVGWDRQGKRVIFSSHRLGNLDVCIATIPDAWQTAVSDLDDGLGHSRK